MTRGGEPLGIYHQPFKERERTMKNQRQRMLTIVCAFALATNSLTAFAQGAPQEKPQPERERRITIERDGFGIVIAGPGQEAGIPAPPPPDWMQVSPGGFYSFEGNSFAFVSSEMSFGNKVVKGAPYSAETVTETIQTLSDGNRIIRRTTGAVYRDSEGRIRSEQTLGAIGPWAPAGDSPRTIAINDPVEGINYILEPNNKTARKLVFPKLRVAASAPISKTNAQKLAGAALQGNAINKVQPAYPQIAKAAGAQGPVQVSVTINEAGEVESASIISGHPLLRDAALEAAKQWRFKPTEVDGKTVKVQGTLTFNFTLSEGKKAEPGDSPALLRRQAVSSKGKTESLGKQVIEGIEAEGTRVTFTIAAGAIGNEQPINIISERWYSPELQTVVMSKNSDPRSGETIYRLTNINRNEPDHSLFEVPADYTIKDDLRTVQEKLLGSASKHLSVSGGVLQGSAIRKVQPPYPPSAKAAGAQGAVQVQIVVSEAGEVEAASVLSGHELLREAALEAAKQWRFKPTESEGRPVKVQGILTFNFTLN